MHDGLEMAFLVGRRWRVLETSSTEKRADDGKPDKDNWWFTYKGRALVKKNRIWYAGS